MCEPDWLLVAERLDEHDYMTGVERTVERVRATGEVFTPTPLVLEILQYCDIGLFAPGKTVLDPACGDGQFLVAAKWIKVSAYGMTPRDALEDIYGIDIMRDNVDLCRRRLDGGTIVMGDALSPSRSLPGQTDEELRLMRELFGELPTAKRKKTRLPRQDQDRRRERSEVLSTKQHTKGIPDGDQTSSASSQLLLDPRHGFVEGRGAGSGSQFVQRVERGGRTHGHG